ncbi:MAG: hypothetical protein P1S46_02780 [bacterium]|nr:hypothetical protein [bacterium]MDT8396011.1 hypothetical protein [bacterium]
MKVRYLILSPSEEARQAFLGGLFGTFELSPRGRGEKATLTVDGGDLEIVATGLKGKLRDMTVKLIQGGVRIDGILVLIPSGDDGSWSEAKAISEWLQSAGWATAMKSWVFGGLGDLNKETAKKALLTLLSEHEKNLAAV